MVEEVLKNIYPARFAYAPNYWQWFAHHKNHGTLPKEIRHCENQVELIQYLGLDLFTRNSYCKQSEYWFGGICEECFDPEIQVKKQTFNKERDTYSHVDYTTKSGRLTEELRYVFDESTVVQTKFLIRDYSREIERYEAFIQNRIWKFNRTKYELESKKLGKKGVLVVGDFYSPLKLLHITLGPVNSVYFLVDHPEVAARIMSIHEEKQLLAIEDCVRSGVKAVMSMDNLDSMFHPPDYVETYSASFYSSAAEICNKYGAKFFIHACGNQKENLKLISSLGVHGLEGVAYPPLGNVSLKEAFEMTNETFIITGGISSIEFETLKTRQEIFTYVKNLFETLKPYKNRFIFSASCNTPINAPWESIKYFRDAWMEYGDI